MLIDKGVVEFADRITDEILFLYFVLAILGYFAWVFLTGCAMIVARHGRQILTSKVAGAALWFQVNCHASVAIHTCIRVCLWALCLQTSHRSLL